MSTLLWIVAIFAAIVTVVVIFGVIVSRGVAQRTKDIAAGKRPRPTDLDSYLLYQRDRVEEMQKLETRASEIYQYAANEVGHILNNGDTETKMNWLNAWGQIFNHGLKPNYTEDAWEEEGFKELHLKVSEYAKQLSPQGLDFPSRLDFDEAYARVQKEHPEHFK